MPTALTASSPPKVFVSYSHKDKKLLERLEVYLKVLDDQKIITLLHSHRTVPGIDFAKEIDKNLSIAQIVLLLVSVDFLASYFCRVESERAMERYEREALCVIPVILRPCNWLDTPFGKLQALPKNGEPVVKWKNRDDAFLSITAGIKEAVKTLRPHVEVTLGDMHFDQDGFKESLRINVGVDLGRITITVIYGSIKIVIEGDDEELNRIVNALRDPKLRRKILHTTNLKSIIYVKDQQVHSIAIGTATLIEIRAIKCALLLAVTAAPITVAAGFKSDYKIAVFGALTMFVLMFGLVRLSSLTIQSTRTVHATSSERRLSITLTWTFVILTTVISLFIFTGFFFSRGPLQAYLHPVPTPSPGPTVGPLPTPTITQAPIIVITEVPPYDPVGGPTSKEPIAGKVSGVRPQDYRIVIYSLTETWYVQPTTAEPKTPIGPDGSWSADIHRGMRYAILLVPPDFQPPETTSQSPTRMSGVVASEEIEGKR